MVAIVSITLNLLCLVLTLLLLRRVRMLQHDKTLAQATLLEQIALTERYAWQAESKRYELSNSLSELMTEHARSVADIELLGAKVCSRTRALRAKEEAIIQYEFINAHQLRAPVARVLGLTQLLSTTRSCSFEHEVIGRLKDEAVALDEVVHLIQGTLYQSDKQPEE